MGVWARRAAGGPLSGLLRTSRERHSQVLRAWLWVEAAPCSGTARRGQERLDVGRSHLLWMACVVEAHGPCAQGAMSLFGMPRIVREAEGVTPVVQPWLGSWCRRLSRPDIRR
jgi:hypothetical protein